MELQMLRGIDVCTNGCKCIQSVFIRCRDCLLICSPQLHARERESGSRGGWVGGWWGGVAVWRGVGGGGGGGGVGETR